MKKLMTYVLSLLKCHIFVWVELTFNVSLIFMSSFLALLTAMNKLYACVVSREDHYKRKDGGKFCAEEFVQHPERYDSSFSYQVR